MEAANRDEGETGQIGTRSRRLVSADEALAVRTPAVQHSHQIGAKAKSMAGNWESLGTSAGWTRKVSGPGARPIGSSDRTAHGRRPAVEDAPAPRAGGARTGIDVPVLHGPGR